MEAINKENKETAIQEEKKNKRTWVRLVMNFMAMRGDYHRLCSYCWNCYLR